MNQLNLTYVISFALVILPACKTRSFNTGLRGKTESPGSHPQTPCHETIKPTAPYTPEILIQQLTAAINQAGISKTFNQETFRDLLFADDTEAASQGRLKPDIFNGDTCSLVRAINQSLTKPSFFYWLTGNGRTSFGGMALYKGDVFAEGFYRNRSSGVGGAIFARERYSGEDLLQQQPWFEWNSQAKVFKAQLGNPLPRLLTHISGEQGSNTYTLYRGTNSKFANKSEALSSLNSFLFSTTLGGIFTTPSYEDAKSWANPVVITSRIAPAKFSDALVNSNLANKNRNKIYAGIEFDYVEIAFLYEAGDRENLFFDNISEKCVVIEKAQGNDATFAPPCK